MAGRSDIQAGRAVVTLLLKGSAAFRKNLSTARQHLKDFGEGAKTLGSTLAKASAAMLIPAGLSIKTFASFDDKMREVKAVSQASSDEFVRLTEKAKKLGATTSFTAVEVAGLMAELGRAGFKPDQVEEMTGAVLDLARATATDATVSSGIMASAIRQFSLEAGDASRVADGLTMAANASFNTVEQLGEALQYAGPVAADANLSLEETLAILGSLGNVGIQGSEAGTALRRLLTLSGADAKKWNEIFGVNPLDAAGNMRPLVDVLGEITEATAGLPTGERATKFFEAFGMLGITSASAIGKTAASTKELLKSISEAGGVANKTAKEMDAGIGGSFRMLLSAVEGVAIAIGEAVGDEVKKFSDGFQTAAAAVILLVNNNREFVVTAIKIAAVVGAAGAAIFSLGVAANAVAFSLGGIAALFGILTTGLGALLSPVGAVAIVLGASAAAWMLWADSGRAAVNSVREFLAPLAEIASEAFAGISDAIAMGNLDLAGQIAMAGLQAALLEGVASIAESVGGAFGDFIGTLGQQVAAGDLSAAWDTVWIGMQNVAAHVWEGIVASSTEAAKAILNVWQKATTAIASMILAIERDKSPVTAGIDLDEEQQRRNRMHAGEVKATQSNLSQAEAALERARSGGGKAALKEGGVEHTTEELERLIADYKQTLERLAKGPEDVLAIAQKAAADDLDAQFSVPRAKLEDWQKQAIDNTAASDAEMRNRTAGGASGARDAADAARDELARLREQAAAAREQADAENDRRKNNGGTGSGSRTGNTSEGAADEEKTSEAVGTFSATAAGLIGGSSPMQRTAKATEETAAAAREIAENTSRQQPPRSAVSGEHFGPTPAQKEWQKQTGKPLPPPEPLVDPREQLKKTVDANRAKPAVDPREQLKQVDVNRARAEPPKAEPAQSRQPQGIRIPLPAPITLPKMPTVDDVPGTDGAETRPGESLYERAMRQKREEYEREMQRRREAFAARRGKQPTKADTVQAVANEPPPQEDPEERLRQFKEQIKQNVAAAAQKVRAGAAQVPAVRSAIEQSSGQMPQDSKPVDLSPLADKLDLLVDETKAMRRALEAGGLLV